MRLCGLIAMKLPDMSLTPHGVNEERRAKPNNYANQRSAKPSNICSLSIRNSIRRSAKTASGPPQSPNNFALGPSSYSWLPAR